MKLARVLRVPSREGFREIIRLRDIALGRGEPQFIEGFET